MGQFSDFYGELTLTIPKLSPILAKRFVNRARRDIYESREWSFLTAFGYLVVPDQVGLGTFTVTQHSATATADVTATTALTGLSNPIITSRQIRFAGGPIYDIAGFSGSTLTLNRPYSDATTVGIGYQCYQCYYGPPHTLAANNPNETDFLKYQSVLDTVQPQALDLSKDRRWLDLRDPQRREIGPPSTRLCAFVPETADQLALPRYEAHPHPTANRYLLCKYRKRGTTDLTADADILPIGITDNCLLSRAMWYAYRWAMANAGRYSELRLQSTVWPILRKEALGEYTAELNKCRMLDYETMKSRTDSLYDQWPGWMVSFLNQINYQGGVTTPASAS